MIVEKEQFYFSEENLQEVAKILSKYPTERKQSALIPLLLLAQKQNAGWISQAVTEYIAIFLELHPMKVYEIASFYTMLNLKPVGSYLIQVCTTTPCWLRGSEDIVNACREKLNINVGETTEDKKFTLMEVECLGACVKAPVVQINDRYYEDLSPAKILEVIEKLE